MGDNTKEEVDDFLNGSSAMGRTRTIAFAKIYITPREPHIEPKSVIDLVKRLLSLLETLFLADTAVKSDDVFDGVVVELTLPPPLHGILL